MYWQSFYPLSLNLLLVFCFLQSYLLCQSQCGVLVIKPKTIYSGCVWELRSRNLLPIERILFSYRSQGTKDILLHLENKSHFVSRKGDLSSNLRVVGSFFPCTRDVRWVNRQVVRICGKKGINDKKFFYKVGLDYV